jgi:hypothetical protein
MGGNHIESSGRSCAPSLWPIGGTTDGRELVLTRHTEPEPELNLLLNKLKLELPAQPPPKITARAPTPSTPL